MKLLLDTHTGLWSVNERNEWPSQVRAMLLNEADTLHISIVSAWEIAIKVSIGKLAIEGGVKAFLTKVEEMPITLLPIAQRHLEIVEALPFIHRDPFDRMLIAQAMVEEMPIMTADANVQQYDVGYIW
ncbi:MAG: type II toxin-antitoxin system VapC family toxin [Defluviitaleaceae bacterium]|nr:type II toxin-antitoxin system VapC family toxin [Defluviitaleaceae bacterium]